MNDQYAKVAIIVTTYNRPHLLKRALNSVIAQTYSNIDIIVVDGGSNSDIEGIVHDFMDDRITFIQAGRGSSVSDARNIGCKYTNAEFLSFLDDDDELLPTKIEKQMSIFSDSGANVGVIYCGKIMSLENQFRKCVPVSIRGDVLDHILFSNFVPMGSAIVKRKFFEEVGGFSLDRVEDWDLWISLAKVSNFEMIPDCLFVYHLHPGQTTNKISNIIAGLIQIYEKHRSLFKERPITASYLHYRIGVLYLQIGEQKNAENLYGNQ